MKEGIMKSHAVIILSVLFLSGCVTVPLQLESEEDDRKAYEFTVTSEPAGADVYVNDKLIGQTPLTAPVTIMFRKWSTFVGTSGRYAKEPYIIKAVKQGYKEAYQEVKWGTDSGFGHAYANPQQTEYHFVLEKRE